jgi:superfamily II DNA or RNA helicase
LLQPKTLRNLSFKPAYSSQDSNLLQDFYIPTLSLAKEYCRITGFFSSDSFAVAAKGISELIKTKGKIKLITGFFVKNDDISAAEQAIDYPDMIMKEVDKLISEFDNIESLFIKESIKAFAWMLANNLLEIKVAFPKNESGREFSALFHQKVGIIEDRNGNFVSFSGSINETGAGWLRNIEEFKVFREWEVNERSYFEVDRDHFSKLWNNQYAKVSVMPLEDAIKNKLVKLAPLEQQEINFDVIDGKIETRKIGENVVQKVKLPDLRNYQEKSIESWIGAKFNGIIEMATGTGKTWVGLKALNKFFEVTKTGNAVVLAPTQEICDQWLNDIKAYGDYDDILSVSGKDNWRKRIENLLHEHKKGRLNRLVIVSTYDSLINMSKFLTEYKINNALIIADEVHSFGSEIGKDILKSESTKKLFSYRLGLSATPERMFDEIGTSAIKEFFGNIVFKYSIGDAIKDDVLCPYNYHIKLTELTTSEFSEYVKLTKKLNKKFHYLKSQDDENYLKILFNERAKITKSSESKLQPVKDILKLLHNEQKLKYTLIFCIDRNQLDSVKHILEDYGFVYSQITGEESREERIGILKDFRNGDIDVLLSIKILDEGINIREARTAIILASSTNPREYIQRRGRVLRKTDGQKLAEIFDFVTVARLSTVDKETNVFDIEQKLIKKELNRAFEFVKYSNNKRDIFKDLELQKLIEFYNLVDLYKVLK